MSQIKAHNKQAGITTQQDGEFRTQSDLFVKNILGQNQGMGLKKIGKDGEVVLVGNGKKIRTEDI